MTRVERMGALSCMGRVMVMHELAHGAGMPGALSFADAQQAAAAMIRRDAAARVAACDLFPFSGCPEHTAPGVFLSNRNLTVTRPSAPYGSDAWARSERGVDAGCGVVRWAVRLRREVGGWYFKVGVASDAFSGYAECVPKQSWFFQDNFKFANGRQEGCNFNPLPFTAGDVVTLELERALGVDGVLRVRVAGKEPQELGGLPRDGMLYPIVGLRNDGLSYTMVALP
jgi:hypothetical protein